MTSLADRLDQYVAERRHYGGNWASQLRQVRPFVTFADSEGAQWITTALFMRWKERFGCAGHNAWACRLSAVRVFAIWLQGVDPRTEVPPRGLIPRRGSRPKPYIYSDAEIRQIVAEAARLECRTGLRGTTFSTMFGLIAVTGMRVGEALALHDADVDPGGAVIRVRHAKNGRDRAIPVTNCTAERLQMHRDIRDRILGCVPQTFFFLRSGRRPAGRRHRPIQLRQDRSTDRPARATGRQQEGPRAAPA